MIKTVKSFFSKKLSSTALLFLVGLFCFSVFIPFLSPYSQDIYGSVHFEIAGQPPSFSHWFGTDTAGRDMFTITIRAAFYSLKIAICLLYTSPSPRDKRQSRMPSSA